VERLAETPFLDLKPGVPRLAENLDYLESARDDDRFMPCSPGLRRCQSWPMR
jgi:hypothetical protein